MPLYRAFLQTLGATLLLAVAVGCRSNHSNNAATIAAQNSATISGMVTYARVPLALDAAGVPTGLVDATVATNLKVLPARGTTVRAYQQVDQTQPDGSLVPRWTQAAQTLTDSLGNYSLTVAKGLPTMVEVLSVFNGGGSSSINLIGDPDGINSTTNATNRLRYALRKAADGNAPSDTNAPKSIITANTVLNFSVGLNDPWWLVDPTITYVSNAPNPLAPFLEKAVLETTVTGRTPGQGSGSRILGIGDTVASFVTAYGTATPGSSVDLHYWPGRSEARGSFLEYNTALFPKSRDGGSNHVFGSLRADATNDDAWDEGVILPLLARGVLYYSNNLLPAGAANRTFSIPMNLLYPSGAALTELSPDVARIEGLADAMAANVLKSPYLADTAGAALVQVRDIRDISLLTGVQKTPFSAPALRALGWEVILKANSLTTPGDPTTWTKIDPLATVRFFMGPSASTFVASDGSSYDFEPMNIYTQINRLKETKAGTDTVDLAVIFTDQVLTNLATPFGIPWPRPIVGTDASFASNWGVDPTSPFPPVVLSMAKAVQVDMPYISTPGVVSYQPAYPNLSPDEVFYTGFKLSADKRCVLTTTITPPLAAGSSLDVDLPVTSRSFTFSGSGGSTESLVLPGNNGIPTYQALRLRVKNPTAIQPDVTVVVSLTPAP